ncbi:hypothetical protein C4D60_Mb10t01270 [Musa balbisiana]|uniref:Uncharacterized protein n=1 Tax=Musa balbisiana TaxID=52838 RepID=A0A4S8IUN7_MUSBA|nr:hypothetical protein C4D60_Mb10t01270 [Musa balbisiana]
MQKDREWLRRRLATVVARVGGNGQRWTLAEERGCGGMGHWQRRLLATVVAWVVGDERRWTPASKQGGGGQGRGAAVAVGLAGSRGKKAAETAKYHPWQKNSSSLSIEFFKQSGWSDAQVMKLNQRSPLLLRTNVETVLKPRMRSLKDMGFSDTEIVQLVSSCPSVLLVRDIQPKINFWRSLLGSNERLLKASRRNMFLLTSRLAQKIEPNISLLRECGISDKRIAYMMVTKPTIVGRSNKYIKEAIKYVEELGVPCNCRMFPYALSTVAGMSRTRFYVTFATLMNFGFSLQDIFAVFRKHPIIWFLSKKNICDKMTFLMKEAGCELTYIISHPVILGYSLEKRLKPRYEILNFLEQNKLLDKAYGLLSMIILSEKKFQSKFLFLLRSEKSIALYDSYVAAVHGKCHVVVEN